ncbi:MAG TPA: hypothetical protein VN428_00850 [Bryobacteraceae bacterium]|nr:hypothetical protein [Bryobacteraceae bacterium]
MHRDGRISIWLFVGVLLVIYGVIITASGLWELVNPPVKTTVLGEYHAPIWWGALLLVLGTVYTVKFRPR